jgi:GT2 family glycosyltransferase
MERRLGADLLRYRGFVESKVRRKFALQLAATDPFSAPHGRPIDPAPAIRLSAVPESQTGLGDILHGRDRIVCVGEISSAALRAALGAVSSAVATVAPAEEIAASPVGHQRPGEMPGTFGAWQAMQSETDRSATSVIVLGRQTARTDMELLRHRVYAHQQILVEAGAPALTWLLAAWGGAVARHGDVFVFSEPAEHFREPSGRTRLAPDCDWPRITVVTISYNQRPYLERCLRSVLQQGYPNLEYIVVDAGSADGSIELLRRYEDSFAKLIIEPDQGQSDGLNKGFRHATGDILTWVNSDDMLAPLSLKRAAMAARTTGADLVAGTCMRIGEDDSERYKHYSALPTSRAKKFSLEGPLSWCNGWEKGYYFYQPEVFFTRSIWERAGGYLKLHLYWAMDWEFWLRCAMAGASIVRIPDILGASREHATQKTTSDEAYLWQIVGILREYDDLLYAVEAEFGAA